MIADAFFSYIALMKKHGLLEGAIGKQTISKDILPLVTAFHRVLAGASFASVEISGAYEKSVVRRFERTIKSALTEMNAINKRRGEEISFG